MISVIVTYKIKSDFVTKNRANIQKFIADFKTLDSNKFQYSVFTKQDGVTFAHHSLYDNEHIQHILLNTPSFLEFQKQRDLNLDESPKIEFLNIEASVGPGIQYQ